MRTSLLILVAAAFTVAACAAAGKAEKAAPKPRLPYDMAVRGSTLYVADGLRHQILRYDLKTRRGAVFAGTGRTGTSGDGGPARRARLTEPTEIVLDREGNLYFSDVNQGRVRRIDRAGTITTVARLPAVAGLSVDPSGRYLAMASIEGYIYRMELPGGPLQRLAGNGTSEDTGDGGPAIDAGLSFPHDVSYERDGNLLISGDRVRRIDAATGRDRRRLRAQRVQDRVGRPTGRSISSPASPAEERSRMSPRTEQSCRRSAPAESESTVGRHRSDGCRSCRRTSSPSPAPS